jgi:hypothetical protein
VTMAGISAFRAPMASHGRLQMMARLGTHAA